MVHLNTVRLFGQRTSESHVIQLPVLPSLSFVDESLGGTVGLFVDFFGLFGKTVLLNCSTSPATAPCEAWRDLPRSKTFGIGLLMERRCVLRSGGVSVCTNVLESYDPAIPDEFDLVSTGIGKADLLG